MMFASTEIVLVHGLWFGAWALAPLARRLAADGTAVRRFSYPCTRQTLGEHARRLHEFVRESDASTRHFVGHSMGGLVILRMLGLFEDVPPGRVVLLGSPLRGSQTASKAEKLPGSRVLTGQAEPILRQGYDRCPNGCEVGMIAGEKDIGLGRLVGGLDGPGDGTVSIEETRAPWLKDHLVLPVTHTGLVVSKQVARQTARFLQTGAFDTPSA
ncbi:MAG: alpha/beta hydrolase [Gammaproteobacteria bacterium]|nr:alpha/beta hydrolase [Gammaproteobacteria bacterium]